MTPPFPNSPAPAWYRQAQWKAAFSKRNGVHYVGDDVVIDLKFGSNSFFNKTADFETGTHGQTIAATDRGSYSAFAAVSGAVTYDNSNPAHGTLCAKIPTGTNNYLQWGFGPEATSAYGRMYLWASVFPSLSTGSHLVNYNNTEVFVSTAGKPSINETNPMSASIALNQWVRLEWFWDTSQVELKLFNSPESTTPTEILNQSISLIPSNGVTIGNQGGRDWGSVYFVDDIQAMAASYPGPYTANPPIVNSVTYTVRDYFGNIVSTGQFEESHEWFRPTPPSGGWKPGWYRVYLTGSQSDANFANSRGATNFCVIRSDAHFTTMPSATTSGGQDVSTDMVMKGVMGMGTSRLNIDNANAPTTGGKTLAVAQNDLAITRSYWANNGIPDSERAAREPWLTFPNRTWDALDVAQQGGGDWGVFYKADMSLSGTQIFVDVSAGTAPSTDKVRIYHPDSITLVETFDNLDNSAEAQAVINAGSTKVRFFARGAGRGVATSPTAIGTVYHDGIGTVVSTLYPDCKRYEGPANEDVLNAELAHRMRLFQDSVKDGNAGAKALGPCSVDITDLSAWDAFLTAGGGSYCDEISFHAYNGVINGDLNLGRYTIQAFKDLLATHGLQGKDLWQTESVHGFTPVYRVYHPRRARKPLMETLLFEQKGVPRERNNQWYDVSHGFWDFPSWIENGDGSLEPQAVLTRVLAEETWGKPLASALDFGTLGNAIYIGNLYSGTSGKCVVVMATSYIENAEPIVLYITGTNGPVTVVDGFGNSSSVALQRKKLSLDLTDVPKYVRLPTGASVAVWRTNRWSSPVKASVSPSATTKHIDDVTYSVIADDGYQTNYATGAGIAPSPAATVPSTVKLLWGSSQTFNRIVVWCGQVWQHAGTMVNFVVETTVDGTNWTPRRTVTKATPSYFYFGTDSTNSGCFVETYWDEQWIFDVKLPSRVTCTGIRLSVSDAAYGGEPLSAPDFGQGHANKVFRIQEIAVVDSAKLTKVLSS